MKLAVLLVLLLSVDVSLTTVHSIDPDAYRTMCEIIQAKNYPCEEHWATTPDGYILGLFRIPYGQSKDNPTPSDARPAVILQHGLLDSSFTWIMNEADESLPYLMADAGFDVWMGNNRGNLYSINSTLYPTNEKEFWQFSWDQMAEYDAPTMIDYILNYTGQAKMAWVGHSEGTTQMFAALAGPAREQLASKLTGFVALGPVITVQYASSLLLKLADWDLIALWIVFGHDEQFFRYPAKYSDDLVAFCADCETCCSDVVEVLCGPHKGAFNESRMPVMAGHEPGGTSVQNGQHWAQMIKHGLFQMFDYGEVGNIEHYAQKEAPLYNVTLVPSSLPIVLYSGSHDILADPRDVANLLGNLTTFTYHREIPDYAHLDYIWAVDAHEKIYGELISFVTQWANAL